MMGLSLELGSLSYLALWLLEFLDMHLLCEDSGFSLLGKSFSCFPFLNLMPPRIFDAQFLYCLVARHSSLVYHCN